MIVSEVLSEDRDLVEDLYEQRFARAQIENPVQQSRLFYAVTGCRDTLYFQRASLDIHGAKCQNPVATRSSFIVLTMPAFAPVPNRSMPHNENAKGNGQSRK